MPPAYGFVVVTKRLLDYFNCYGSPLKYRAG